MCSTWQRGDPDRAAGARELATKYAENEWLLNEKLKKKYGKDLRTARTTAPVVVHGL